ncbi:helix-turn-helix domain-containing protein [Streptomyces javensis]|uniref:helix-turn-helix domain-containing protein n=1 Tax=Streptomyces javensis TaxID=114698 RepID=UPI0033D00330
MDSILPDASPRGFDGFRRDWRTQIGDGFPLPRYSSATIRDFRVKSRVAKVRDVVIANLHTVSPARTTGAPPGVEDQIRMYIMHRGTCTFDGSPDRGEHTLSAGQFLLRHVGRPLHFQTSSHQTARTLFLPSVTLKPLLGNRNVTGWANSAEVRLLVAHTDMIHATMADLSPAGVDAAHNALVELVKAVARGRFDDVEPRLAPALVQAAKELVHAHLADPELSPAMLAHALNVSIRTLQRAFAAVGDSVTAYVRHRRLEEARLALISPSSGLTISELAAHWQFADRSHFIRTFKKHYGQTPTDYARSTSPTET